MIHVKELIDHFENKGDERAAEIAAMRAAEKKEHQRQIAELDIKELEAGNFVKLLDEAVERETLSKIPNQKTSLFFSPRVGVKYEEGLEYKYKDFDSGGKKLKTLILGIHQICNRPCRYKSRCTTPKVREMDGKCPNKIGYPMSNSNRIEIDDYIKGVQDNSCYSAFTKFMLNRGEYKYDHLSNAVKSNFWEHVILHNFFQYYLPNSDELVYEKHKKEYQNAIPALKEVLEEYKPQMVVVCSENLCQALKDKDIKITGLKFEKNISAGDFCALFTYKTRIDIKVTPAMIKKYLEEKLTSDRIKKIKDHVEDERNKYKDIRTICFKPGKGSELKKDYESDTKILSNLEEMIKRIKLHTRLLPPDEAISKLVNGDMLSFHDGELKIFCTRESGSLTADHGRTIINLLNKLYKFEENEIKSFIFKYKFDGKKVDLRLREKGYEKGTKEYEEILKFFLK